MRRDPSFERQAAGILCLLAAVLVADRVSAQDEPSEQPRDPRWQEIYKSEASGYRFETAGPQPEKLAMQPQPLMQWVSLNDYNGDVFVWTLNGHPELVGTIFSRPVGNGGQRNMMHEFHSLSAQPIKGTNFQEKAFSFAERTQLKTIRDAPLPADSPARRQLQARALAKQFSAHMDRQGERWELRLLNQPLYRYEQSSDTVLGGAIFAFVGYVTDPEILILIEARRTERGPVWSYAAARFSDKSLWLSHKGTEVWKFLRDVPGTDGRYYFSSAKTVGLTSEEP